MQSSVSFHRFAVGVQTIGSDARRLGLIVPYFRCPPRRAGATRTIQFNASGAPTVRIALRERGASEVFADVVDAILFVNAVGGDRASDMRARLEESFAVAVSKQRTAA